MQITPTPKTVPTADTNTDTTQIAHSNTTPLQATPTPKTGPTPGNIPSETFTITPNGLKALLKGLIRLLKPTVSATSADNNIDTLIQAAFGKRRTAPNIPSQDNVTSEEETDTDAKETDNSEETDTDDEQEKRPAGMEEGESKDDEEYRRGVQEATASSNIRQTRSRKYEDTKETNIKVNNNHGRHKQQH